MADLPRWRLPQESSERGLSYFVRVSLSKRHESWTESSSVKGGLGVVVGSLRTQMLQRFNLTMRAHCHSRMWLWFSPGRSGSHGTPFRRTCIKMWCWKIIAENYISGISSQQTRHFLQIGTWRTTVDIGRWSPQSNSSGNWGSWWWSSAAFTKPKYTEDDGTALWRQCIWKYCSSEQKSFSFKAKSWYAWFTWKNFEVTVRMNQADTVT